MKEYFCVLKYPFKYIIIFIITHLICVYLIGLPKMGISTLYDFHIVIVPFFNYLVLSRGIMLPLSKDLKVKKKGITNNFLIITSLFNLLFYGYLDFTMLEIGIIIATNIMEFILMKPQIDNIAIATQKNIDEYFNKRRKKEE